METLLVAAMAAKPVAVAHGSLKVAVELLQVRAQCLKSPALAIYPSTVQISIIFWKSPKTAMILIEGSTHYSVRPTSPLLTRAQTYATHGYKYQRRRAAHLLP